MYDFYTIILYGIMLNLCQSWLLKLDIACHCSLFGSFGKYRNRTESTDTEFPRYRVSAGTDRYRLTEEPNLYGYRRTEPIGSVLPNAQGELACPKVDWIFRDGCRRVLASFLFLYFSKTFFT